jgi:nucleoside-diphosphate-sugar epimerase
MDLRSCKVAITGIGGFIGLRLAEVLRDHGAQVHGLELPGASASRAAQRGFRVIEGTVTDEGAARACVQDTDVVVHTAAIVGEGGSLEAYRAVNVGGTMAVASAAKRAGTSRFVHLSSVMVHGFTFPDGVTEDGPLRGENNAYCQTKIEAEAALLPMHTPSRFEVTVIRPGDVYGPGSMPWVVRPLTLMKRGLFVLPDGGHGRINHVHVDSLVDGIRLALVRDASGVFCLSDGVSVSCKDYFERLGAMAHVKLRSLPSWALVGSFSVIAPLFEAIGKEPPARADAIRFLLRPATYSIAKARQILGYQPRRSLEDGMNAVERWAREERLV